MVLQAFRSLVLVILFAAFSLFSGGQKAHTLQYAPGKSITLTLPATLDIDVAATGLRRVRFFAKAPDGRIFATGMYNLADNRRGSVFILEGGMSRRIASRTSRTISITCAIPTTSLSGPTLQPSRVGCICH